MNLFHLFITLFVVGLNCAFCGLQIGLLRRRKPWPKYIGAGLCLWTLLIIGISLLQVFSPAEWRPFLRRWLYFPLSVEMVWNLLFLQALVLGSLLATLALGRLRPVPRRAEPLPPEALSRRRFVYLLACGAAPAAAVSMGVHGTLTRYDLRVRRYEIVLANLPRELEGFTIAHVSDLHSGIFCGPRRLGLIASAISDLKADLITITGDIINADMSEFPDALAALQRLRAPYGIFVCEGNHDLIPGPGIMRAACNANRLPMLFNETATLTFGSHRLLLAGLPWMRSGFAKQPEIVSRLYPERREGDVRLLMAHHPHLFDIAESADLVLSGHTHGGQVMAGPIGLGPLFFKYWSGRYQRNSTTMIVSNGCGDWFPCRIGAPAEIGLLRLTARA